MTCGRYGTARQVTLEIRDEMTHVFQHSVGFVREVDEAVAHIAEFVRRRVGLSPRLAS